MSKDIDSFTRRAHNKRILVFLARTKAHYRPSPCSGLLPASTHLLSVLWDFDFAIVRLVEGLGQAWRRA